MSECSSGCKAKQKQIDLVAVTQCHRSFRLSTNGLLPVLVVMTILRRYVHIYPRSHWHVTPQRQARARDYSCSVLFCTKLNTDQDQSHMVWSYTRLALQWYCFSPGASAERGGIGKGREGRGGAETRQSSSAGHPQPSRRGSWVAGQLGISAHAIVPNSGLV